MKPMLAKKFKDFASRVEWPMYTQPKLNGVRALGHDKYLQSRDELLWNRDKMAHILNDLDKLPKNIVFDGELYRHGTSLQKINSAVSINSPKSTPLTSKIQYHIYDCLLLDDPKAPFSIRNWHINELLCKLDSDVIVRVETHLVNSEQKANEFFSDWVLRGYEGSMLRKDEPYGILQDCGNKENRWDRLLKKKDFLDTESIIVGTYPGKPGTKYESQVGGLNLVFENGVEYNAGSGLSDMQRQEFVVNPPVGKIAKIKYEMLSDSGTPLKGTIEAILD